MTTDVKIRPQGFWQILQSKLEWIWCPSAAEEKYDYFEEGFRTHLIEQRFEIHLFPRDGDGPDVLSKTLVAEDALDGTDISMTAENRLKFARSDFLREAGKYGVEIEGQFYPHSRIDKISPSQVRVIRVGSRNTQA